jgi:hypothetical protein
MPLRLSRWPPLEHADCVQLFFWSLFTLTLRALFFQ